jgi:hypothetical protein
MFESADRAFHRILKATGPERLFKFIEAQPRCKFDGDVNVLGGARWFGSLLGNQQGDDSTSQESHLTADTPEPFGGVRDELDRWQKAHEACNRE